MIRKLLYITHIDLEAPAGTGSAVRPLKMKEAFESLRIAERTSGGRDTGSGKGHLKSEAVTGIEVRTFGGADNDIRARSRAVRQIRSTLKKWRPDAVYIEPPSGPMFYFGDVELIKTFRRAGIPTSIFYRDAYWKYPEYAEDQILSIKDKAKQMIVKRMQIHQWNVFKKYIDRIYFPSELMGREFDCPVKGALPPGGFIADAKEKKTLSDPIQFLFVGGAAKNHGTILTIDAFEKLNENKVRGRLFYICPEQQWKSLGIDETKYASWLEVIHASGDEQLRPYYERTDVTLLTAPRSFYRDFAVPIKIYEYMSYLKPVLVTDCTETARVVRDNRTGWICADDVDSVAEKLRFLCDHPEAIEEVRDAMSEARENNLWVRRAEQVIADMEQIISS